MTGLQYLFSALLLSFSVMIAGCTGNQQRAHQADQADISQFITYQAEMRAPRNAVCEDLNGDGLRDIAIAEKSPSLNIFLNSPQGLSAPVRYETYTHNMYLSALDIDSDGDIDLVPATETLLGPAFYNENGLFRRSDTLRLYSPKFGSFITSGDLNGDGKADMIILGLGSGDIKIIFNRGENKFEEETLAVPQTKSIFGESGLKEALVYDMNADGMKDILVADYTGQRILAAINASDTKFSVEVLYTFDSTVSSIGIIEHKGKLFIAAALESAGKLALLEQTEGLNFTVFSEFLLQGLPRRIVVKDINDDGAEDLIVALHSRDGAGSRIKVLYNPISETVASEEVYLPDRDCAYLSVCDIYARSDFLCSDVNRGQFFILNKDVLKLSGRETLRHEQ